MLIGIGGRFSLGLVKVNAIVRKDVGTFVWWSDERLPAIPYLRLQMNGGQLSKLQQASTFELEMHITRQPWRSESQMRWQDVQPTLESFTVNWTTVETNAVPITECRLPGNVRGVFLTDIRPADIRIIVPIMENSVEVPLNYTFLEWTKVSIIPISFAIGFLTRRFIPYILYTVAHQIPRTPSTFQAHASLDRIELIASNPATVCLQVCLHNHLKGCMFLDRRPFIVGHLTAQTNYTLLINECGTGIQLQELSVRTPAPSECSMR